VSQTRRSRCWTFCAVSTWLLNGSSVIVARRETGASCRRGWISCLPLCVNRVTGWGGQLLLCRFWRVLVLLSVCIGELESLTPPPAACRAARAKMCAGVLRAWQVKCVVSCTLNCSSLSQLGALLVLHCQRVQGSLRA
jgi:hypothetical protein